MKTRAFVELTLARFVVRAWNTWSNTQIVTHKPQLIIKLGILSLTTYLHHIHQKTPLNAKTSTHCHQSIRSQVKVNCAHTHLSSSNTLVSSAFNLSSSLQLHMHLESGAAHDHPAQSAQLLVLHQPTNCDFLLAHSLFCKKGNLCANYY